MTKRISRDEMFMRIAYVVAERGTCPRAKVGAVLVDRDHKIRSIGYNGNPPGAPHCEDVGCMMKNGHCTAIHAEVNALMYGRFETGIYDTGYTLYVTHKPCEECKRVILKFNSKIKRVVYDIPYRYEGPEDYEEGGVMFEKYKGPKV